MRLAFNYRFEPIKDVEGPMIVVANHNCDLDPVMVGLACPHMYFVASEHIFRRPAIAWLLEVFLSPIARRKGSVDASTVMEIRSRIKAGHNIAIFPEGNRSLDGRTGVIHPTTGKLIKAFGATLVTYHLEGGFFTTPRWGFGIRKGKMTGRPIGIILRVGAMKSQCSVKEGGCLFRPLGNICSAISQLHSVGTMRENMQFMNNAVFPHGFGKQK